MMKYVQGKEMNDYPKILCQKCFNLRHFEKLEKRYTDYRYMRQETQGKLRINRKLW